MSNKVNDEPLSPLRKALGASLTKPIDPTSESARLSRDGARARLALNDALRRQIEGPSSNTRNEKN